MTLIVSFKMLQHIQILTILSVALACASADSRIPEKLGIPQNLLSDKRDDRKFSGFRPSNIKGMCNIFFFYFRFLFSLRFKDKFP